MSIYQFTLKCVKEVSRLFNGARDQEAIQAHISLNSMNKNYQKAFQIIEQKNDIIKYKLGDVTIYQITTSKHRSSLLSHQVIYSEQYICNCQEFSSKDFVFCAHILAVMIAEELNMCQEEFNELSVDNFIEKINNFC